MSMTKKEYRELLERSARDGTFPCRDPEKRKCMYRYVDEQGVRHACAIGVAIPDAVYSPEDEKTDPYDLFLGKYRPFLPEELNANQLLQIRNIHDGFANWEWHAEDFITSIRRLEYFQDTLEPEEVAAT